MEILIKEPVKKRYAMPLAWNSGAVTKELIQSIFEPTDTFRQESWQLQLF